jgi:hypothetical protein
MFYSAAVFAALLAGGNAFMPSAPQRMTGLKMSEAWFPDATTSNTVSGMDALE